MRDFFGAPFLFLAQCLFWVACVISGRDGFMIMSADEDDPNAVRLDLDE